MIRKYGLALALLGALVLVLGGSPTLAKDKDKKKKGGKSNFGGIVFDGGANKNNTGLGYQSVPGAKVVFVNTEFEATTDQRGYFFLEKIPVGKYTLEITKEGYKTVRQDVEVTGTNFDNSKKFTMVPEGVNFVGTTPTGPGTLYIAYAERQANKAYNAGSDFINGPNNQAFFAAIVAGVDPMDLNTNRRSEKVYLPGEHRNWNPTTSSKNTLMMLPAGDYASAGFHDMTSTPYWLCFDKDGKTLYVATSSRQVQVIDAVHENRLLRSLPVQGVITDLTLSPDGKYVLVSVITGNVVLINTETKEPQAQLVVEGHVRAATMSPQGDKVYVVTGTSTSGNVQVVDVYTGQVSNQVQVGANPTGIDISPDGRYVYVVNAAGGSVTILDGWSLAPAGELRVGVRPQKVAVSPDGSRVYVSNRGSDTVSVFDGQSHALLASPKVGKEPLDVKCRLDNTGVYVSCYGDGTVYVVTADGAVEHSTEPMPVSSPFGLAVRPYATAASNGPMR